MFSSVLSVGDCDLHNRKRVDILNERLCEWGGTQGFGHYGLGCSLEKGGMLMADGSQLTLEGPQIFLGISWLGWLSGL